MISCDGETEILQVLGLANHRTATLRAQKAGEMRSNHRDLSWAEATLGPFQAMFSAANVRWTDC